MSLRTFEPLEIFEWRRDDILMGMYIPGLWYNCSDDEVHAELSKMLDQWLSEGKVKLIDEDQAGTTSPAKMSGQVEVK